MNLQNGKRQRKAVTRREVCLGHRPGFFHCLGQLYSGAVESFVDAVPRDAVSMEDGQKQECMDFHASGGDDQGDDRGGTARLTRTHCAEAWPLPIWKFRLYFE